MRSARLSIRSLSSPAASLMRPADPRFLQPRKKFLRVFGLSNLGELPEGGALRGAADALLDAEEENEQLSIEDEEASEETTEEEAEELYVPDEE